MRRASVAAVVASLAACGRGAGEGTDARAARTPAGALPRSFDAKLVPGLVGPAPARYEDVRLDYALDTPSGDERGVTSCRQVAGLSDDSVATPSYALLRDLRLHCLALKRYAASAPAARTHFPARLPAALVGGLPADAVALVSPDDLERRRAARTTLTAFDSAARLSDDPEGGVVLTSPEDETRYRVLARADFDGDGAEDILVRTEWSARDASGTGTDLLLLSKPSASAPVTIAWRAPLDSLSTAPTALLR